MTTNKRFLPKSVRQYYEILHNRKKAWQYWFFQSFLGINKHVPWPVHWTSVVTHPEKVSRKVLTRPNPGVQPASVVIGDNGIQIGLNVWLGPGVKLISARPDPQDYSKMLPAPPIILGDHCWLGAGAIIYPGVSLGNHVIVAAGAVVTQSIPEDNVIIGGNPARILKTISPYSGAIPSSDSED
jgi:acetyltransferase-like isoleucine patch superfamily enzyme